MRSEQEYILTVYEKGSFSKAAQALYLTQPALSIAIQKVEAEIGMPLFDRSQKPLALTEAGHVYIEKLKQMRVLENELHTQLLDLTSMKSGSLRIGATSYHLSCILPPVLLRYKQAYPGVSLEIVELASYELKEQLRDQQIDITFASHWSKDDPFTPHPVFQDRLLLAVPAELPINRELKRLAMTCRDIRAGRHLDPSQPSVDPLRFDGVPFILLEPKYDLRMRADTFFQDAGFVPDICMEVAQIVTAYALAQEGMGATVVPDRAVVGNQEKTVFYKLSHPRAIRNMNVITNNRSYLSCATERFIEMLADYYRPTK